MDRVQAKDVRIVFRDATTGEVLSTIEEVCGRFRLPEGLDVLPFYKGACPLCGWRLLVPEGHLIQPYAEGFAPHRCLKCKGLLSFTKDGDPL